MVLRWFRGERDIPKLGRDHEVSRATAYRYIDEGIDVCSTGSRSPSGIGSGLHRRPRLPDHGQDAAAGRPVRRTGHQRQGRTDRSVILRQGPPARRQRPGPVVPDRAPAVGLRCRARLGPRPDGSARPPPRRLVRRSGSRTSHPGRRRLRRRRNRRPDPHQEPSRRLGPQLRQPHLQQTPALLRRTRIRPTQRPLTHPPAHHHQPQRNPRHHCAAFVLTHFEHGHLPETR